MERGQNLDNKLRVMLKSFRVLLLLASITLSYNVSFAVPIIWQFDKYTTFVDQYYFGQSVVMPSGVAGWNNITFNFFDNPSYSTETYVPFAGASLFILSQPYIGSPIDLNDLTPGYIGESEGTSPIIWDGVQGNMWIFNPLITLQPDEKYYFSNRLKYCKYVARRVHNKNMATRVMSTTGN